MGKPRSDVAEGWGHVEFNSICSGWPDWQSLGVYRQTI